MTTTLANELIAPRYARLAKPDTAGVIAAEFIRMASEQSEKWCIRTHVVLRKAGVDRNRR
jgi:hypothetical protein